MSNDLYKNMSSSNFLRNKTIFPNRDARKFDRFNISFKAFWKALLERIKMQKDCFILVTGPTGSGKSSLVAKMNFRFAEIEPNFILNNNEMMFIPEKHFVVDGEEFAYKMITEQGSSIWYDEAREGSNRQAWFDKINKSIKKRKNTNRKLFNIYWFCMPLETEFDPKLAAHLSMWIWVKRGVGEVYIPNNQRKGGTGLNIEEIIKREERYLKENPKRTFAPPIIHPEYVGRIFFSKLTKEEDDKYKELVRIKSATGKLTDEEIEKFGIEIKKTPEQVAEEVVNKIVSGEITDKYQAWKEMSGLEVTDANKLKLINFYLKLHDKPQFSKVFSNEKEKLSNLASLLKKKD